MAAKVPKAVLVLKTYDPESGVVLKFKTDKAADVGRLIAGLGRLGRRMAALPDSVDGRHTQLDRAWQLGLTSQQMQRWKMHPKSSRRLRAPLLAIPWTTGPFLLLQRKRHRLAAEAVVPRRKRRERNDVVHAHGCRCHRREPALSREGLHPPGSIVALWPCFTKPRKRFALVDDRLRSRIEAQRIAWRVTTALCDRRWDPIRTLGTTWWSLDATQGGLHRCGLALSRLHRFAPGHRGSATMSQASSGYCSA